LPRIRKNNIINIVQICEGCLGDCSYCIVKKVKGKLNSYPSDKILKEIEGSVRTGCKEIWLTSQDNGCYGIDNDNSIVELLKRVIKIKGNFKIRLGMINPNHVLEHLDALISVFKDDKMFKFLHIPVQSGSDKILKDMNRYYTSDDFLKIVKAFRKEIPEITIATDIIVGYPTEGDSDFKQSIELIKELKPDVLNISRYWQMPGTEAAELPQLDVKEIMKRSKEMSSLFDSIALENNKKLVGKEYKVLVDEGKKGNWIARNDNYKQIIINSDKELYGKCLNVKVTEAGSCDLKAVSKSL
jgi:MiaB-like tRNA modifying enzyme